MLSDRNLTSADGFLLNLLFILQKLNEKVKLSSVRCFSNYQRVIFIVYIVIISGVHILMSSHPTSCQNQINVGVLLVVLLQ